MGAAKELPWVLAVARDARQRQRLAQALEPDWRVRQLEPGQLDDPAPLLDAAGAVVGLDGRSGAAGLEALAPVTALPAGSALVLALSGVADELVERALARLVPAQVVGEPLAASALRYALHRALPPSGPGRGALDNQRRAPVLLGVSSAIREVIAQIHKIAPTGIPALILGETGTGKELVARAIHQHSPRAEAPFVAVNCSALPDTLLESELFGHKRGAFTGAERDKRGLFEVAEGGTVFLDEIGDTSPAMQAKLLRVLENREVRPVGGTRSRTVDVRIVSATHCDLEQAIEAGEFRQDLYYRLNAVTIYVPPLRRRRVDIPFLAQHFAEEFGASEARRITLGDDFLTTLAERSLPGNVRELRNAVERAIALAAPGEPVSSEHLPPARPGRAGPSLDLEGPLKPILDRVESDAIRAALARFDGNRSRAAEALGLTRPGLSYKMRRLGLEA